MKTILLTMTLGLLLGDITNAQERNAIKTDTVKTDTVITNTLKSPASRNTSKFNRGSGIKKYRQLHQLHDSLNLSAAQKRAFKDINAAYKVKSDSIRTDTTLSAESRKAARKQLMSDRQKELFATLNTDQQQRFSELQQRRIKQQHNMRMHKKGDYSRRMKTNAGGKDTGKPNASLQNTYWKLSKIKDKQVITPENAREIHIMFANDGKTFKGFAGCNGLGGDYKSGENQSLTIRAISTKMYCERMADENFLTNAVSKVNRYRIKGEQLLLFHGNELLASFDAVYF